VLNHYKSRTYQQGLFDAIERDGKKKALLILPRRSGKDIALWNLAIRHAIRKTSIIWYIFPTYSQARKALYDSMTNDGFRFLDYIPKELIARQNEQQMKITFTNGSIIQLIGSQEYDALMGSNPSLCIFSEYALQDPRAYQYIRPMLTANNGIACFCSTVRGKNHLWDLYNIALNNPATWYCCKLSVEDTKHIAIEDIEAEIAAGEMSRDMARQEYWNDFNLGVEGSYYARYLDQMELEGRLGNVPYEPGFRVNTAWDLGMRDSTSIIFFQVIGTTVHIIDTYQNTDHGLEHYIAVVNSKPWASFYGRHFAPHDAAVRELGTGLSRLEKARQLGIIFELTPNIGIIDGIEAVRTTLPRCYIDQTNCKPLIATLANYRKVLNPTTGIYDSHPLHDKFSHMADALRYLCVSLPKTRDGMTAADLQRIKHEAIYGEQSHSSAGYNPFVGSGTRRY
jgi:phage terminase large subunit